MQPLAFPHGGVYQIICQENGLALTMQAKDVKDYKKSRIVGAAIDINAAQQLWMIEKCGPSPDSYEIINCISDYVMDEEGKEIKLLPGRRKNDQLYQVQQIPNAPGNYFWFKTNQEGLEAIQLEGILRVKPFDPVVPSQVFVVTSALKSPVIAETSVLVNNGSGKALDVPEGSRDPGDRIIQYARNKRFNQRWRWIKSGAAYILINLLNGLALDIAGESKDNYAKVVQWSKTGGSNQLWNPVPAGNGVWKIQSVHAAGMCLAIHNESLDDGGKLSISSDGGPTSFWRFEDYSPK